MALKKNVEALLREANELVETVSIEEGAKLLEDDGHLFVDIRDIRELQREGMIPGAFKAPRGMLEFWVDPECRYHKPAFATGQTYILYCHSAWRSALAAKSLMEMGFGPLKHLQGGFAAWKTAGLPVAQLEKKPTGSGKF